MKKIVLFSLTIFTVVLFSCNQPIKWDEAKKTQFSEQCLKQLAQQFKAENPAEFCECFVGKLEAENMGLIDMAKNSARFAKDCGAQLEGL